MGESILMKLEEGHRVIKDLMNLIKNEHDLVHKKELYLQMREELLAHMDGEEKTIYRHLIEDVGNQESEEVAHDAEDEHEEMRHLCDKLDATRIEDENWESTFKALRHQFLKHQESEESALFTEAKEDFSREELSEFGEEFEEAKLQSHP